jgi:hypothetical protein
MYSIFDNEYRSFDFPTVGKSFYRVGVHQPDNNRKEQARERKMCRLGMVASGMRVRQNGKDGEQICEEKSARSILLIIVFNFIVSVCHSSFI